MVYVSNGVHSGGGEPTVSSLFGWPALTQIPYSDHEPFLDGFLAILCAGISGADGSHNWEEKDAGPARFDMELCNHLLLLHLFQTRRRRMDGVIAMFTRVLGNLVLLSLLGWQEVKMQVGVDKSLIARWVPRHRSCLSSSRSDVFRLSALFVLTMSRFNT